MPLAYQIQGCMTGVLARPDAGEVLTPAMFVCQVPNQ